MLVAGSDIALSTREAGGRTVASFENGATASVRSDWLPGESHAAFDIDGRRIGVKVDLMGSRMRLRWQGIDVVVTVRSPRVAALASLMLEKLPPDMSKILLCPMPGVVTSIAVAEGDEVEAGQTLATVEAMKMENVLRADRKGTVKRVAATSGASLAVDELIMEFE